MPKDSSTIRKSHVGSADVCCVFRLARIDHNDVPIHLYLHSGETTTLSSSSMLKQGM